MPCSRRTPSRRMCSVLRLTLQPRTGMGSGLHIALDRRRVALHPGDCESLLPTSGGLVHAVKDDRQLVTGALVMAIWRRSKSEAVLHHSDGSASTQVSRSNECRATKIRLGMSRSGNCWDNVAMERVFSSLKTERTAAHTSTWTTSYMTTTSSRPSAAPPGWTATTRTTGTSWTSRGCSRTYMRPSRSTAPTSSTSMNTVSVARDPSASLRTGSPAMRDKAIPALLHLIEPAHSERFLVQMSRHYPAWREARAELNE